MKKTLKWTAVALLTPIVALAMFALLFYFPPFQNWAVRQVAAYASERTGMEISVEHVHLAFPLDLSVEGVKVIQNGQGLRDTLIDASQVVVDVQFFPLFRGQVEVDALEFHQTKLNTDGLIPDLHIKGDVGSLSLESHGINLKAEEILVNSLSLADASVDVILTDTVPPDTTESEPLRWKAFIERADIQRSDIRITLPDTTLIAARMQKATLSDGRLDLGAKLYEVRSLNVKGGKFSYGQQQVDISRLSTGFLLANQHLRLTNLEAETEGSKLRTNLDLDLNAFDKNSPGQMSVALNGSFSKKDLIRFLPNMPKDFWHRWPDQPLSIDGVMKGNLQHAWLHGVNIKLPTAFT
ncbi:MAG: AsmA family protein, partial [Prevotella sp.]|nr:AsmA family protein [Prevotella sp.]